MYNIKNKLKNSIVDPAASSRSSLPMTGIIIEANEKLNVCTVEFKEKTGASTVNRNVPVFLYNKNLVDWFPKVGENVIVMNSADSAFISGPAYNDSYSDIRSSIQKENDIYSGTYNDFLGGYIF